MTFFDLAVFERIKKQFGRPDLEASAFRRNVITAGIDLNKLIGKKFTIQNIVFEGTEESKPCYWMNGAVAEGAEEALKGWGAYALAFSQAARSLFANQIPTRDENASRQDAKDLLQIADSLQNDFLLSKRIIVRKLRIESGQECVGSASLPWRRNSSA